MNPTEVFLLWKCGKKGKHVGCQQGCDGEYGTWVCQEYPDSNAPSIEMIKAHMEAKKSLFGSEEKKT
jgi:hypothetical protein